MPQQIDLWGKTKVDTAIEFIKKHEPPEGYFLGFSGGKDSIVLHALTKKAEVKFQAYYSCTGIDPPELVKFIKGKYPAVTFKHPKETFWALILKKQFPTIFRRWCCDELKKKPTRDVPLPHRLMGTRAEESPKRAARPQVDYFKRWKQWIYKPIFYWLEWEIWDYIDSNKIPYCSLYNEGFDRIGCVVCPYLTRGYNMKKVNIYKARWPKIYLMFEKTMTKYYELKKDQLRENSAEELIHNWYMGN